MDRADRLRVPTATTTTATKRRETLSPAAWIIGLSIAMVLLAVTPIVNGVRYLPFVSGSHFPTGAFAVLVILTLMNAGLRKLRVVWVLSPAQLVAIWAIIAVSSGIAHNGLMSELVPQLPAYQYYSSAENKWDELFGDKIPSELLIHNADATRTFYEGLAAGQPVPWGVWLTPMAVWALYAVGMEMARAR